jgi:hypothetical protein
MKVYDIARICHEANRIYCETLGDYSQPHWEDAPDWQKDSAVAGVTHSINAKSEVTSEASHNEWMHMKLLDGWKYGEVKDASKKEHPCLVPYTKLPVSQQKKDWLFLRLVQLLKTI